MDVETDERIQMMVRREFAQCTVLAIAHRLGTIIDYDAIVVLDKGQMVEHGSPAALLSSPRGHFARLVEDTGAGHAEHLRELAQKASEKRNRRHNGGAEGLGTATASHLAPGIVSAGYE